MAQRYNLAELHGGPLDGQVVQVPIQDDGQPELVVGVPVPVLDERTERFWWDTGNYFLLPAANPPKRGQHWYYAYARTLPGFPTLSRDHSPARTPKTSGHSERPLASGCGSAFGGKTSHFVPMRQKGEGSQLEQYAGRRYYCVAETLPAATVPEYGSAWWFAIAPLAAPGNRIPSGARHRACELDDRHGDFARATDSHL